MPLGRGIEGLTGKCPVSPALEGGGQGAQYRRKVPYREVPPFRAWNFTQPGVGFLR
jgi:hypothetical protein